MANIGETPSGWTTNLIDRIASFSRREPEPRLTYLELIVAEIGVMPQGTELLRILGIKTMDDLNPENLAKKQQAYRDASKVIVLINADGIGDSICWLRHAKAMALIDPDKQFYVMPHPALKDLSFDFPPNLTLISHLHSRSVTHQAFWCSFSAGRTLEDILASITRSASVSSQDAQDAYEKGEYLGPIWFSNSYLKERLRADAHSRRLVQSGYMSENASNGDVLAAMVPKLLGLEINRSHISQPLLVAPNLLAQPAYAPTDLLIIPDAGEGCANDYDQPNQPRINRSSKSLSSDQWRAIFAQIPPQQSIRILMGKRHPDYTNRVFDMVVKSGVQPDLVSIDNLAGFPELVMASKKVVCMDSGTTHLAAEVALAANQTGRILTIREIFEGRLDVLEYGIRGLLPGQGKILVCGDEDGDPIHFPNLSSDPIVNFILA